MKALTLQYRQLPGMLIAMPYLDVRLQHGGAIGERSGLSGLWRDVQRPSV